jgi:hypothetical protein
VTQVAQAHVYSPPPPLNAADLPPGVAEVYLRCMAKDPAQRPSAAEVFGRLSQSATAPLAQQTMVMPSFEAPDRQGDTGPAAPPRAVSRLSLLIGALIVAAAAAGVTALLTNTSHPAGPASGASPTSATASAAQSGAAGAGAATTASPSAASGSPSPSADLGDPAGDPIGYLEAMRAQIDGLIAQGQDTMDANTGRDLQNSLADLQNAITAAEHDGGGKKQRAVRDKIGDIEQKIADDLDRGKLSQDAADQLTGELRDLSDALSGGSDGN